MMHTSIVSVSPLSNPHFRVGQGHPGAAPELGGPLTGLPFIFQESPLQTSSSTSQTCPTDISNQNLNPEMEVSESATHPHSA